MNQPAKVFIVAGQGVEDQSEWPEPIWKGFQQLAETARDQDFSLICAVGLNHTSKNLSAHFSPHSSSNPHLAEMCEDISEMFKLFARRFRQ